MNNDAVNFWERYVAGLRKESRITQNTPYKYRIRFEIEKADEKLREMKANRG